MMMNRFKFNAFVIAFLCTINANSQIDSEKLLFSKMDISPQFELWDGNHTMLMGYTELLGGSINLPSPILTFTEGDSVKLTLSNFSQTAPHTIHLHGLDVNQQNDGVPHLSFEVEHLDQGDYFFKVPHPGTYLYHCHVVSSLHVQAGMYGMIVVRPADESNTTWTGGYEYHREYAWLTSELDTNWHHDTIINHPYAPLAVGHEILDYDPQYFFVNGKAEQQLEDESTFVTGRANEYIYLRLANVGYFGNRIVFPASLNAKIVSSDGRPLPNVEESDSLDIMPGERFGVLLHPTTEMNEMIDVDYFSLNTPLIIENTQELNVEIQGFLSVKDEEETSSISVYPNPGIDVVSIDFGTLDVANLKIYNMQGELVLSKENVINTEKINTSEWRNGVYLIEYSSGDQIITQKLTIKK